MSSTAIAAAAITITVIILYDAKIVKDTSLKEAMDTRNGR